ncbi:ribonuclease HII [Treponema sp. OMZ 840]|uniref:ribonuclease HII n=1 Tax=Treponema sp. OMZ 840 TaxID=244313 RepID=UPI003D8F5B0A
MNFVCGLDEAGRGPLAGPVTAAAVFLPDDFPLGILNDSKKLSEKKRSAAEVLIKEKALAWAVASVGEKEIDRINILQASLLAMKQAFEQALEKLYTKLCAPSYTGVPACDFSVLCIADGNARPDIGSIKLTGVHTDGAHIDIVCEARVKADAEIPAVMAASILAKTERDRIMCAYAQLYPAYGYEKHKGYPTSLHRKICREIGPSPIQRMSFSY